MRWPALRRENSGTRGCVCAAATLSAVLAAPLSAFAVDLVPVGVARLDGGADSAPPTPVRVRVSVLNASSVDMPASHAAGWAVQVQGHLGNPHLVRRALRGGEQHSFTLTVIVPCGKATELAIIVNPARAVGETNYDNNRATFPVQGNACPLSLRSAGMSAPGIYRLAAGSRR